MVLDNRLNGTMFWCCSDVYEEQFMLGKPFHGGFGLVSNSGIPKPNFWAFKLLSQLYGVTDGSRIQVLVYSQDNDYHKSEETTVEIELNVVLKAVTAQFIDDRHCNPKAEWFSLGSPDVLTNRQATQIKEKTALKAEKFPFAVKNGRTIVNLMIKTNDVVLLSVE